VEAVKSQTSKDLGPWNKARFGRIASAPYSTGQAPNHPRTHEYGPGSFKEEEARNYGQMRVNREMTQGSKRPSPCGIAAGIPQGRHPKKFPDQSGAWWAGGLDGYKLLIVDTDKSTGEWLVRIADAIHGWPLWFKPDFKRWTKWIFVEKPI